ncbi:MAG: hypothetical protein OXH75_22155 [Acidobacteria bacterium]|nr:hypothetical protein [Acidobacteriota bacterium]
MAQQGGRTYEGLGMVAAMLGASFLGGAVAASLIVGGVVDAQEPQEAAEAQETTPAPSQPQVLNVSQINLLDGSGRLRGVLAAGDERGFASLAWYDPAGQVRSLSGVGRDGTPVVQLYDSSGQPRLQASVDGETAMIVAGAGNAGQGYFGAIGGSPLVTLTDGTRNRLQLLLSASGRPRALLSDDAGRPGLDLSVGGDDMPRLALAAGGRLRGLLTVAQNAAVINLRDGERPRLILGVAENGRPSVNFFDENGEIAVEIPSRQ